MLIFDSVYSFWGCLGHKGINEFKLVNELLFPSEIIGKTMAFWGFRSNGS